MKKFEMAEAAEQLLVPTDWLPSLLRTAKPAAEQGRYTDRRRLRYLLRGCRVNSSRARVSGPG